ncbi:GNAT family N-acetyltransferase [Haloglycomyces albus]|uniref:GNAT family N-acetyltransferase n=1 Tax=Haloglycomyces albus TaxID=526067 RepID=UPI001B7FCF77|nr:GNAT family protein [Haloglycomyces albus]
MKNPGWPAVLTDGDVTLRPFRRGDGPRWSRLRRDNEQWLAPWEPSPRLNWYDAHSPASYRFVYKSYKKSARQGTSWPWAVCYRNELVGGLTIGNIIRRASGNAFAGYWIDSGHAGLGITTTALALSIDHALTVGLLHRIEVNIRPENIPSNRVVEKLGLRREGLHERFLYIAGAWRDHYGYAITAEEISSQSLLDRLKSHRRRTSP